MDYPGLSRLAVGLAENIAPNRMAIFVVGMTQLLKIGDLPVQIGLQTRYYAEKPDGGPDWGSRIPITFVFPK